jgi:rod shape-determining protein MreC
LNWISYRLNIALSTDFSRLRDVSVINDREMDKKLELLRAAEDSIKARQ